MYSMFIGVQYLFHHYGRNHIPRAIGQHPLPNYIQYTHVLYIHALNYTPSY